MFLPTAANRLLTGLQQLVTTLGRITAQLLRAFQW